jgi:cytochrome c-type biogenesis protein CcmH
MMVFWFVVAAMLLAALVFVLPPLLGWGRKAGVARDEVNIAIHRERLAELQADLKNGMLSPQQFDQARQELEKQLLQDVSGGPEVAIQAKPSRWGAIAAGVALPALALGLYLQLGGYNTPAFNTNAQVQQQATPGSHPLEERVAALVNRLRDNPNDPEGWHMLGRAYMVLQRYANAAQAYAQAYQLIGDDPPLMADYAEALALANQANLLGKPSELVNRALKLQPNNPKALWLAGIAAVQKGDTGQAVNRWERLLGLLPKGSNEAIMVERELAKAKGGAAPQIVAQSQMPAPSTAGSIKVRVTLAPEVATRASAEDIVFIFARPAQGPRMPLAIVRKQVKELPVSVILDDSMAMTPTMKLSNFADVVIEARVSKSGSATRGPGDLEAERVTARVGSESPVELTINQVAGETKPGQGPSPPGASPGVGAAGLESTDGVVTQWIPAIQVEAGAGEAARPGGVADEPKANGDTQGGPIMTGRGFQVRVTVAPNLANRVSPEDAIFIYARAAQGPRMPFAIVRRQAKELPTTVTLLDDAASMRLSNFPLVLVARVSKSGNAIPQSGDLQGFSPTVQTGVTKLVEVTIDKVIP